MKVGGIVGIEEVFVANAVADLDDPAPFAGRSGNEISAESGE